MYSQPYPYKENISKEINRIIEENKTLKSEKHDRKQIWKNQSLVKSLYNREDGLPDIKDINQGGFYLNSVFKNTQLPNCFLLAPLMGLAKQRPDFIKNNLIKEIDENEVEVDLFPSDMEADKPFPNFENSEGYKSNLFKKFNFEDGKDSLSFQVTKDEILNWKTNHKALWPVVIEIAFAKFMYNVIKAYLENKNEEETDACLSKYCHTSSSSDRRKEMIRNILKDGIKDVNDYRHMFVGANPALAFTILTGQSCYSIDFNLDFNPIKIPNLYETLKNQFDSGKIITADFVPSIDSKKLLSGKISITILSLLKYLKDKNFKKANGLLKSLKINPAVALEWLKKQNIENSNDTNKLLEDVSKLDESVINEFILENINTEENEQFKVSKTKYGTLSSHSYLLTNVFEYNGNKFVTLRNPHDEKSKIDYKASVKRPPEEGIVPNDPEDQNEFIMFFPHFCRYLRYLSCEV